MFSSNILRGCQNSLKQTCSRRFPSTSTPTKHRENTMCLLLSIPNHIAPTPPKKINKNNTIPPQPPPKTQTHPLPPSLFFHPPRPPKPEKPPPPRSIPRTPLARDPEAPSRRWTSGSRRAPPPWTPRKPPRRSAAPSRGLGALFSFSSLRRGRSWAELGGFFLRGLVFGGGEVGAGGTIWGKDQFFLFFFLWGGGGGGLVQKGDL